MGLLLAVLVISLLFSFLLDLARLFSFCFLWLFWLRNKLFNLIAKDIVEFMRVLLDPHIDWLTVKLKRFHKAFWDEVRFF